MPVKVKKIVSQEIEVPDLAEKMKAAQAASGISVSKICTEVGFSRTYWYFLVNGQEDVIAEATLRKIEKCLDTNFGVDFP